MNDFQPTHIGGHKYNILSQMLRRQTISKLLKAIRYENNGDNLIDKFATLLSSMHDTINLRFYNKDNNTFVLADKQTIKSTLNAFLSDIDSSLEIIPKHGGETKIGELSMQLIDDDTITFSYSIKGIFKYNKEANTYEWCINAPATPTMKRELSYESLTLIGGSFKDRDRALS